MTSTQSIADPPDHTRDVPVLRCTTTADFLAALPQLVGFVATASMFVVFFTGKRAGPTIRIDLPSSDETRDISQFIDAVCDLVRHTRGRYGAGAPAIVISCSETFAESRGIPWRRLAQRLERRLERNGVRLREMCCLAPDAWASYLDPATPLAGRPLADIAASPVAPRSPVPHLDSLGAFAEPSERDQAVMRHALTVACAKRESDNTARDTTAAAALVGENEPSVDDMAQLICAANRDDGWLAVVEQLCATATAVYSELAVDPVSLHTAGERLRSAALRLVNTVNQCPEPQRPSVISLCAFAWWLRGLQSVAAQQIAVALDLSPDHEHANIICRLIDEGTCPLVMQGS